MLFPKSSYNRQINTSIYVFILTNYKFWLLVPKKLDSPSAKKSV